MRIVHPDAETAKLVIINSIPYQLDELDQIRIEISAIDLVTILKTPNPQSLDGEMEIYWLIKTK